MSSIQDFQQGPLGVDPFDQCHAIQHRAGAAIPFRNNQDVASASTAFSSSGRPLVDLPDAFSRKMRSALLGS